MISVAEFKAVALFARASNLEEHARRELELAGLFSKDSDYEGMLGDAVLALIKKFASQGHSGFSAYSTIDLFNRLARFKPLTPLTSNPEDWSDIREMIDPTSPPLWQNKRCPSVFSKDGGKTWYDVEASTKDHRIVASEVLVPRKDMETLSSFRCQNYTHPDTCYDHPEQGGACNSCWVRAWAQELLSFPLEDHSSFDVRARVYRFKCISHLIVQARLVQRYREEKKRTEWALVSRKGPIKTARVLKWFGTKKPSKERVLKEERRVQFFKNKGG